MKSNSIIQMITKEFDENNNSHIFLIETNNAEKTLEEIKTIISNIIHADEFVKEQLNTESYLEHIIVRPDGAIIKKNQISFLQERLKNKPILSNYLFYSIVHAEDMNDISSNKLLKTIEEPQENVIGFLITTNIDIILPTIKSRCELLHVSYDENIDTNDDEKIILDTATELIKLIEQKNLVEFNLYKNNSVIKENMKAIMGYFKNHYDKAVGINIRGNTDDEVIQFIQKNNTFKTLLKKDKYINKVINKNTEAMNNDLFLEMIYLEME